MPKDYSGIAMKNDGSIGKWSKGILMLIMVPATFALTSCNKNNEDLVVRGQVMSLNEDKNLDDVLVELFARKIQSGIYTANYVFLDSVRTDQNGSFTFDLPDQPWTNLKIYFTREGYYNWDYEMSAEPVRSTGLFDEVFSMDPISWLNFRIKNSEPFDDNDFFELRLMNGLKDCSQCCSGDMRSYRGKTVDEHFICQVIGHQTILMQWNVTRNGQRSGGTHSVFVASGDTATIDFY